MTRIKYLLIGLAALVLSACSTNMKSTVDHEALDARAKWALLPIANHTDTPQAGLSAEAMVEHLLRHHGISSLMQYPSALSRDSLFEPTERKVSEEARAWATAQGARYGVTGNVQEWRYKVGIDGEPAVGVTLKVIELSSGNVVWTASGAKSGGSREALSGVAQKLMHDLLDMLDLVGNEIAAN